MSPLAILAIIARSQLSRSPKTRSSPTRKRKTLKRPTKRHRPAADEGGYRDATDSPPPGRAIWVGSTSRWGCCTASSFSFLSFALVAVFVMNVLMARRENDSAVAV